MTAAEARDAAMRADIHLLGDLLCEQAGPRARAGRRAAGSTRPAALLLRDTGLRSLWTASAVNTIRIPQTERQQLETHAEIGQLVPIYRPWM